MDNKTQERIKADALKKYPVAKHYVNGIEWGDTNEHARELYIAGATAVHDRAQVLVDALEWIKTYGPCDNLTVKFIDKQLEQWKGKEAEPEPELKEPDKNYSLSTEEKKKLLASKIEARMKEAGLQRQEFADLMGTQPSTITRWLSGEHNFQIDTLFEIEKQLNVSLFNY